jgi:hypothetical protein
MVADRLPERAAIVGAIAGGVSTLAIWRSYVMAIKT